MSGEKIYTGAEAMELRTEGERFNCEDSSKVAECAGLFDAMMRLRDAAPDLAASVAHWEARADAMMRLRDAASDLAASVAHWEARAIAAEAERERLLPRKGEHVNDLYACVARVLSRLGVQDRGGDPLEALESWADEEHARSLAETDARNAIAADRDAALAHAAELEAALREARAGLDNAVATAVELRAALTAERAAGVRAEAEVDGRGRDLVAVVRELDALRAIIEGRTTPPTREEAEAHFAGGGSFRVRFDDGTSLECFEPSHLRMARRASMTSHWWALDSTGRPCALVTEAPDAR